MLYGKEIVGLTTDERFYAIDQIISIPCIQNGRKKVCQRCFSQEIEMFPCELCQTVCGCCVTCMGLGKMRECCMLWSLPEPENLMRDVVFGWKGQLTNEQQRASDRIVLAINNQEDLLLSAVTGAGKTEMMFAGIYDVLKRGGRVCVAAPRVDVCLELAPRICAAFPQESVAVLHGNQTEPYQYTKLVIATTHQLLKFKAAFDLLIIDEPDSFPFHNNVMLQRRVSVVLKENGHVIYLTATPTRSQQRAIKKGTLKSWTLSARYHQHALPVPKFLWVGDWKRCIHKGKLPPLLWKQIRQKLKDKKTFLIFVPHVALMHQLEKALRVVLPKEVSFTSVFANDPKRIEKVRQMREHQFDFLLTTTILERGVTFANIDVIVIGAEDPVFTTASLVQIAGRVGRKETAPTGEVLFMHNGQTIQMKRARKWVVRMNTLARKKGLIK